MNWQQMIQDILDGGLTQAELAGRVGCGQGQISALLLGKRGERVSYEIGNGLVREHKKILRMKKAAA